MLPHVQMVRTTDAGDTACVAAYLAPDEVTYASIPAISGDDGSGVAVG